MHKDPAEPLPLPPSLCALATPSSPLPGPLWSHPLTSPAFCFSPGWGSWRKAQPLRVSSQEQFVSRPGFPTLTLAHPLSRGCPALPAHFCGASEGHSPKCKPGPIPSSLIFSGAPYYLQEKIQVIQGVDGPWLTSQALLPRPNLQPPLQPFEHKLQCSVRPGPGP